MEEASGRRPAQHVVASPRLRRREHAHERRRTRISSCSAAFLSWWVVVCVTALPTLCLGQERTEDGKERGPNSTLAKEAELWLPIALVGCLALLVIVFCVRKAREARSRVEEEGEAGLGDVEEAKDEQGLGAPVERISRPAIVWDKKPSATASFTTASGSGASSSSYEEGFSGHGRSRSSERRHVSGALRSASKLPRYSSDRLQSPVHGGTGTMVAGGRRSGGRRTMQRGDTGPRVERVQEGAAGGSERLGEGFVGGSSPPEAPHAHQDASIGDNSQEIYIVHQ